MLELFLYDIPLTMMSAMLLCLTLWKMRDDYYRCLFISGDFVGMGIWASFLLFGTCVGIHEISGKVF